MSVADAGEVVAVEAIVSADTVLTDATVDAMARLAGQAFARRLRQIQCERSEHIPREIPDIGLVCSRCSLHIEDAL